jgi:hypothetical protein
MYYINILIYKLHRYSYNYIIYHNFNSELRVVCLQICCHYLSFSFGFQGRNSIWETYYRKIHQENPHLILTGKGKDSREASSFLLPLAESYWLLFSKFIMNIYFRKKR